MEEVTGGRLVGEFFYSRLVEGGDKRTLGEGLWRIKEEEEYKGKKGVMRICELRGIPWYYERRQRLAPIMGPAPKPRVRNGKKPRKRPFFP